MKTSHLLLLSIFLINCLGAAYDEQINDNYYLQATDTRYGMTLCIKDDDYLIGIVSATVFAVGYNEDFIIVKQHPEKFPKSDKSITNYYIIPLKFKVSEIPERNVIGPLTEREFMEKRKELGVSRSLQFTRVFKDLE